MGLVRQQMQQMVKTLAADIDDRQEQNSHCCKFFEVKIAIGHFNGENNVVLSEFMDTSNMANIRRALEVNIIAAQEKVKFSDRAKAFELARTKFNELDAPRLSDDAGNQKLNCLEKGKTCG